jgi:plastocyanin domain-containing protein
MSANLDSAGVGVLIGGIALSVAIVWYFFGPKKRTAASVSSGGVQEISINVKGAYSPAVIVVKRGSPVRLNFYRDETSSCSEEVILSDFGIARKLPAFQTTSIEFTPDKTGEFTFTCGMNMLHGKLVVEPA